MATISENKLMWDGAHDWSKSGDEWSEPWGTAQAQWVGCLLPRVFPFLKGRMLEIGSGHGRWTQFLQGRCSSLIGIDLVPTCIERCTQRFAQDRNLEFHVNDGLTFPMVENESIDFAFSFDSLVHAESDVMRSYTKELARVLKPGAVAFLHHSNLAAVHQSVLFKPWRVKLRLSRVPYYNLHWRAASMSAEKLRGFVQESGMSCVQQEMVPWGTSSWMTDCLSTIINSPSIQCRVIGNPRFMEEAAAIKRISSLPTPDIEVHKELRTV
ncbi:class I SAM-dependent methyltransferase [Candidatus Binatus sp.]|uniref:class I SAM-dependent methyltransferase n=1 Tax=Candidatus Binatus sp. TaxID=2811406 RepID=UPI003BAFD2D7